MSAQDTFDRNLESWLAEGPHRLPEAAVNRIVGEIERIDTRKPAWLLRRETVNRLVLSFGGVAVLLIAVIGAAYYFNQRNSSPGTNGTLFTSSRHGYSVRIPTNWSVNEVAGEWQPGSLFAGNLDPGVDDFVNPDQPNILRFMKSQPITAGMTSDQWMTQFISIHDTAFPECRHLTESDTRLVGEDARVYTFDCSGSPTGEADWAELLVTHDGRGYAFRVNSGPADEKALLLDWVATLGWVPVVPAPTASP